VLVLGEVLCLGPTPPLGAKMCISGSILNALGWETLLFDWKCVGGSLNVGRAAGAFGGPRAFEMCSFRCFKGWPGGKTGWAKTGSGPPHLCCGGAGINPTLPEPSGAFRRMRKAVEDAQCLSPRIFRSKKSYEGLLKPTEHLTLITCRTAFNSGSEWP
jgi:hypothetical protein